MQDLTYLSLIFLGANRIDLDSSLASETEVEEFVFFIIKKLEDRLAFNFQDNQFKKKINAASKPCFNQETIGFNP